MYNMGGFQKMVILLFILLLIIILFIVGFTLSSKQDKTWPPIVGDCPDYWLDANGDGSKCQNVKRLGTCYEDMDFTTNNFLSVCNKYQWANKCGVTWDGITNLGSDPCNT
jgi:Plasmodium falciparum domain of unknown function (CPW_WPC)